MAKQTLTTIGIAMPDGFPIGPFEAVHARVHSASVRNEKAAREYYGAENGVAYRFRACCEYSDDYVASGTANSLPEDRHYQEKALFGFFVSGFSVIESFCYGAFMVGALIDPLTFPIKTDKALKDINPNSTATAFSKSKLSGEPISSLFAALFKHVSYEEWATIRNLLAHRQTPGRHFNVGGPGPFVVWKPGLDVELNADTTSHRKKWLATTLTSLMEALDGLTAKFL